MNRPHDTQALSAGPDSGSRVRVWFISLLMLFLSSGCAMLRSPLSEAAADMPKPAASAVDPWERFNRAIFDFNDVLDRSILIPVAKAYKRYVPVAITQTVDNVLANVGDAWSALNLLLQGKPRLALDTGMRVGVNSVFGLVGALDVASEMGLERQPEDFGQTLGVWGFGSGPYVVLPLLGPSSLRDGLALPLDRSVSLSTLAAEGANRYSLTTLELVHARAGLLNASTVLGQVALDRYSFVRDSYLARRRNLVYDGNPPPEPEDAEDAAATEAPQRKASR
ncbi:MAG: VacJ family lipoprotein [Rubrivivax sp.]|nr:VacJ family lipoprotein [Rubrivivax sp.]